MNDRWLMEQIYYTTQFPKQNHMNYKNKSGILKPFLALDLNYGNRWY